VAPAALAAGPAALAAGPPPAAVAPVAAPAPPPSHYITKLLSDELFFAEYLHNRVGTCLFMSEKERLIRAPVNPKKGDLLVWEQKYDTYQWVVYLNKAGHKHSIYCYPTENNPGTKDVFIGSLYAYNSCEPIQHKPKDNLRYDEKFIFETYTLN
jgi:hypothetical protein